MTVTDRLERVELLLTPLTPVHVGAGEDFDPTGYVIHEGFLYHFDPAALPLDAGERSTLMACANKPGGDAILALQRFFHERTAKCVAAARFAVPVVPGVAEHYRARVGQTAQRQAGGRDVVNALTIERTAHHPHTGLAYLPGTSLKGAMRTAWLDSLNQRRGCEGKERASELERRLMAGSFHTDPFRLVGLTDAAGDDTVGQVFFATNHKKRPVVRDGRELAGRGPAARRECIAPAQHAALRTTLTVRQLAGHRPGTDGPDPQRGPAGWVALAGACNRYYLGRMRRELDLLDTRRLAAPAWVQQMRKLLDTLHPWLATGDAALLRVGRHSGAESVTLDGVREIRIMKGPGKPAATGSESTTVWLAAARENARSDMLPFGWVLAHRADVDLPALHEWCAEQPRPEVEAVRARLRQAREAAARAAEEAATREAERRAQIAATAQAAAREQARLQALTPESRDLESLRQQLESYKAPRKQPVGGQLYSAVRQLVQRAEKEPWAAEDRRQLASLLRTLVPEKIELGGKAKELRDAARRLDEAS
jgi:CRISPR-associated protein Csm5